MQFLISIVNSNASYVTVSETLRRAHLRFSPFLSTPALAPAAINQSLVMCGIVFFISVLKSRILFEMSFVRFVLKKMRFCSDIVI